MLPVGPEGSNPLAPGIMGLTLLALAVLALALFVAAVISIARARRLGGVAQAVWVLIVLAFPVLGPVLWFVIGRSSGAPGLGDVQAGTFGSGRGSTG